MAAGIEQLTITWHLRLAASHHKAKSESYERHFVNSQDLKVVGENDICVTH
jgi:hypothetical protein